MSKSYVSKSKTAYSARESENVIIKERIGTNPDSLIFPEWSDFELNAEMWDSPKPLVKSPSMKQAKRGEDTTPDVGFLDPHSFTLPSSFNCSKWKRPEALFPGKTLVVHKESSVKRYTELIARNKHLMNSGLMRSIVYCIGTLEYLGFTQPWPIEGITAGYCPTTVDEPWKPWHHIYSLCKAGKGKYIVRIFWLGAWRRIIVDDYIPVNQNGMILLPTTVSTCQINKEELMGGGHDPEANMIELWPFLLSKAIVKIANLTWTEKHDQLEFSVVVCLTGWICQKINTLNLEPMEIWDICTTYVKNVSHESECRIEKPPQVPPCFLMAEIVELRYLVPDIEVSMGPCYRHSFIVNQIRTSGGTSSSSKEDLPAWKRFRWMRWASDNGVQDEEASNVRQVELVDFFNLRMGRRSKRSGEHQSMNINQKSVKGNRSTDISPIASQAPPAPKTWLNFFDIAHLIEMLMIYQRPEAAQCHIEVTDIAEKFPVTSERDKKKADMTKHVEMRLIWPYRMKNKFNSPLYLYMDSLDVKTVTFVIATSGNREILEQKPLVELCDATSLRQMSFSFLERSRMRTIANIVIETFDWARNEFQEFVMGFLTIGCKSMMHLFAPGRVILRIWMHTNSSYSLRILSDTNVELGKMEDVLKAQCRECDRLVQYCYDFGTCFGNLVQTFGTEHYASALGVFHKSYRPPELVAKQKSVYLEDKLFHCLEEIVVNTYPECGDVMFALRVLFMKPGYGIKYAPKHRNKSKEKAKKKAKLKEVSPQTGKEVDWESSESCQSCESVLEAARQLGIAAVKIQSYFRMWYVRRLRQYHDPEEAELNSDIFDSLRKLYKDVFNVESRLTRFTRIVRKFLLVHDDFAALYPFGEDLRHVVDVVSFDGEVPCRSNSWTTIVRYIFYINSPFNEDVRICLVCNMPEYVFKVYDNDTRKECLNSGLTIEVTTFASNEKGYTVLAYGMTHANQEKITFHISFITLKRSQVHPLIIHDCPCKMTEVNAMYHHNVNALIGKCILTINQDMFLTLRLTCSFEGVRFLIRILDVHGKVVQEKRGTRNLIIPVVELEHSSRGGQSSFPANYSAKLKRSSSILQRRRSFGERSSSVGSVATRSTRQSKPTKAKDVLNPPSESKFFIEMYVLNGSWPLTPLEWLESDKLRKRNLIGPGGKVTRSVNVDHTMTNYDLMPDPKWTLQVIYSEADCISLSLDQRRDVEIQEMKLQWYKDPKRYAASKLVRDEYYQAQSMFDESESYITSVFYTDGANSAASSKSQETSNADVTQKSFLVEEDDDVETRADQFPGRSNDRPPTRSMLKLAPFTFSCYALPFVGDATNAESSFSVSGSEESTFSTWTKLNPCYKWSNDNIVKNIQDWQADVSNIEMEIAAFKSYHEAYIAKMRNVREKCLSQNAQMEAHFEDIRAESVEFVNKAYMMRAQCIEKLAAEAVLRKKQAQEANKSEMSKSASKSSKSKRKQAK